MTIQAPKKAAYALPSNEHMASSAAYASAREALIQAEQTMSFVGNEDPSQLEQTASLIVQKLKNWEEVNTHSIHPNGTGFELGHKFLHGLATISKSRILEIAKRAPKGALLHCHLEAMLRPSESLLIDAREEENMYICVDAPLTSKGFFEHALPAFDVLPEYVPLTDTTNVYSRSYIPGSYMKYSCFLQQFPGGPQKGEEWVESKMMLHAEDTYHPEQTVDGIWLKFLRTFMVLRGLFNHETAYKNHFRRVIWHFASDGIMYSEIRISLHYGNFCRRKHGAGFYNHKEMVQLLADVLQEELPKMKAQGLAFTGVRFIYVILRSSTKAEMAWCIDDCIAVKQAFPDLICGLDLAGPENNGHPLSFFIPELLEFREKCDGLGLDVPFIFHAGETLDHGGDTDSNLYDAILLGTKRIGHGYSLTKHPLLMQLCKDKGIAVEICPISNEVLGLCPTVKNHPLPVLLSNCVPCSINSDDPGVWESTLSHDFYQVIMGSNRMSLTGWRVLVQWSIEYSCMKADEKERAVEMFTSSWEGFCRHIVERYGSKV